MKKLFLLAGGLILGAGLFAQSHEIKGKVTEESGESIPGVNVSIKGTAIGTITNLDGEYTLSVEDKNAVLVFSFIGFTAQEEAINGKSKIDVILRTSFTELDEVVAVGYGTMKKRDLTGSVSSVSSEQISKIPTPSVAAAIAGKVSGVQITSTDGSPDAGISVRVRGGGSITQDNSPLYVIDGFPSEDGINFLDPTDIETIDILKDASSAAIYGARGANGVVLITTKGGKESKPRINFDAYVGVRSLANSLDLLSPEEFVKLQYENVTGEEELETFKNTYGEWSDIDKNYKGRKGLDWQDEMFGRTATIQNYKFGIAGGSKETKYNISLSRNDSEGIMVNSGFERTNARLKLDQKVNSFIDASFVAGYQEQTTYGMGTGENTGQYSKLTHVIQYRPTIGINGNDSDLLDSDEDPALVDDSGNVMQNPLVSANAEHREKSRKQTTLNGSVKIKITKDLTAKLDGGLKTWTQRRESYDGLRSVSGRRRNGGFGYIQYNESRDWNYAATLNYVKTFGKHDVNAIVGHEQVRTLEKFLKATSGTFQDDVIGINNMGMGIPTSIESGELLNRNDKLISFFGRVNYSIDNKYLFSATMRADGSSKLALNNRTGYFPSGSFGWRISEESFMDAFPQVSNLKLRLSYGASGNNRIINFAYMTTYGPQTYGFDNQTNSVVIPTGMPVNDIKWETTHSTNAGLDVGLLDQRIRLSADFYLSRTKDLLLDVKIPGTSGFSSRIQNIGETENKGAEFSIQTVNIKKKDFEWSTNFNISFNKNKIVKLADGQDFFEAKSPWADNKFSANDYIVRVGESVGAMYGFVYDGLYTVDDFNYDASSGIYTLKDGVPHDPNNMPQPGYAKFKNLSTTYDADGNPIDENVIDENDRKVIGNANPVHFGGITNNFSYKNWDLSVFMNWSFGNDVYNANKMFYTLGFKKNKNMLGEVANRWMTINAAGERVTDPVALSELNKNASAPVYNANEKTMYFHSGIVEDASYLRINNITLGYNVPKKILNKLRLSKLRVYASANNVHTWTNYSGYDPEVATKNTGLTPGVDWAAYPRSRSFIFGVNVSL